MPHPRHTVLAWLAAVALQLTLLGVNGVSGAPAGVRDHGTRPQSGWPTVSYAKRLLAPEPTDRRATITPFAPAAHVRVDLPTRVVPEPPSERLPLRAAVPAVVLPPARAPPALS
jgi:hypothetical protein